MHAGADVIGRMTPTVTRYPDDPRRLIIARIILSVRRAAIEAYLSPTHTSILLAIGIGRAEGRLLDVSGVAAMACTSRQTVLRAVSLMRKRGDVEVRREGRRTLLTIAPKRSLSPDTKKFFDRAESLYRRAVRELSESDT
jgi:hypothetical protein